MISRSETSVIGRIIKTHGINGEVVANIDCDIDVAELSCIILDIDGILVPFFTESTRQRSAESILLKIDGIDNEIQAAEIVNHDIYAKKEELVFNEDEDGETGFYASDLIGYKAIENINCIGEIEDIDDSTENALFIVRNGEGKILYIPIADEYIEGVDENSKTIRFLLPEGILDL